MSPDEDENGMLYFNGVNGDRGGYEIESMSAEDLFKIITDETDEMDEEELYKLKELRYRYEQREIDSLGVKHGVNANNLGEAGWGIIFAHGADPEIKEALSELIELRRDQAGEYFRLYEGQDAYRPGESKRKFLARHGAGPGPADPEKVPYYLLIVGDPETIPYGFQSQLDVQYAVGRIHFESLDEYANYARSVVAAERGQKRSPRRARFFGVANEDDRATQRTVRDLVEPLYQQMQGSDPEWDFEFIVKEEATKARLTGLLGGDETPGLLFTASHGMNFDLGSSNQIPHQGALLCQDWLGPEQWPGSIPRKFYFSADDMGGDSDLQGMIAFFFACFGAGTPTLDQFVKRAMGHQRAAIAPHDFLARLPMAMLGRSRGGALAVVGHVDRALSYSFRWPGAGVQTTVFESTLKSLISGHTVGFAVEYFNERYAELSTVLSDELKEIEFGKEADPGEITGMWAANNDARGYALIGDPAVRLVYPETNNPGQGNPVAVHNAVVDHDPAQEEEEGEDQIDKNGDEKSDLDDVDSLSPPPPRPGPGPRVEPGEDQDDDGNGDESERDGSTPDEGTVPREEYEIWLGLYHSWADHTATGYKNNDKIFQRILKAFMISHYSTLIMYWIMFAVGIGLFILAAVLAVGQGEVVAGVVFGGLSVTAFLTYFVSRPTQSIEENLNFVTWLGIIYSSYWTHQAWEFEPEDAQKVLDKATNDAITQMTELVDRHAKAVKDRPSFGERLRGEKKE